MTITADIAAKLVVYLAPNNISGHSPTPILSTLSHTLRHQANSFLVTNTNMSNNTLLYQVIPMSLPGFIGSQSSSLDLRLVLGAVGLVCLVFANFYALK